MMRFPSAKQTRGSVLIIAIGITIALTGLVFVFTRQMRVELLASGNMVSAIQAGAIVRGAAQHVAGRLATTTDRTTLDTVIASQGARIGEGQYWILRPDSENEQNYGYGIVDEASKLNINTATIDMLMLLPGMTPELAASIVDWRDEDSIVSEGGGAESESYLLLPDPYYCKNAPFETLDELRLVKGATLEILYGVDLNHNGVVDATEAVNSTGLLSLNGQSQCGIVKYLTVSTVEANTSSTGQARMFVGETNNQAMNALSRRLLDLSFEQSRVDAIVGSLRGQAPPLNVLDFYKKSTMTLDEFKKIADLITTDRARVLVGRVNVNTAPREVLRCLPGLDEGDVEALIAARTSASDTQTVAWVAEAIPPEKGRQVGSYITTRSSQYSADIAAVGSNGRGFKRSRYVFDLRSTPPRILYRQDMTHLGWPLSSEIYDALRSGQEVPQTLQSAFSTGIR